MFDLDTKSEFSVTENPSLPIAHPFEETCLVNTGDSVFCDESFFEWTATSLCRAGLRRKGLKTISLITHVVQEIHHRRQQDMVCVDVLAPIPLLGQPWCVMLHTMLGLGNCPSASTLSNAQLFSSDLNYLHKHGIR